MGTMINRRRVFGGKSLPYDAEIEYLGGVTGAYIKTGVFINSTNWRNFVLEFDGIWKNGTNSRWLCQGIAYRNPEFFVGISPSNFLSYGFGATGSEPTSRQLSYDEYNTRHLYIADYPNQLVYFDDESYPMTFSTSTTFNNNKEFYIFTWNSYGDYYYNPNYMDSGKMYGFRIIENGIIIRDLIPVRVGNVGYMYDKVSKQLFGNAGTGDFILGPDK